MHDLRDPTLMFTNYDSINFCPWQAQRWILFTWRNVSGLDRMVVLKAQESRFSASRASEDLCQIQTVSAGLLNTRTSYAESMK